MQTHVSILHHDYPARLRGIVAQRLEGLTRFDDRIVTVSARLARASRDHHVELVANVGRGNVLVANVKRGGLRVAVDDAVAKLRRQIEKHHDKVRLERRRAR